MGGLQVSGAFGYMLNGHYSYTILTLTALGIVRSTRPKQSHRNTIPKSGHLCVIQRWPCHFLSYYGNFFYMCIIGKSYFVIIVSGSDTTYVPARYSHNKMESFGLGGGHWTYSTFHRITPVRSETTVVYRGESLCIQNS